MNKLTEETEAHLKGVHPDLVKVIRYAAARWTLLWMWKVGEGVRTVERQKMLVAKGASKTMNSRHIPGKDGFGKACDFVAYSSPGKVTWELDYYRSIYRACKEAAVKLGIPIIWGNDWDDDGVECGPDPDEGFVDACHIELNRHVYP